jgi:uncharacterized membrane protein
MTASYGDSTVEQHVNDSVGVEGFLHGVMEGSALGIEVLAVAVIVIAIVFGTSRFLLRVSRHRVDAYQSYKTHLVKALLLGLEFLVAADIVRTVALEATLNNVAVLAALVVVRTFLSWSLVVEMDGRWPWQTGEVAPSSTVVAQEEA